MCQPTSDTYINTFPESASYILKFSSSFLSHFATNISYQFHISCEPTFTSVFSSHILSIVYDKVFQIAAEFQKNAFDFFCLVTRNNYLNMYQIKNFTKLPIPKTTSQWSRELSARHV